jgi:hypothetical protein
MHCIEHSSPFLTSIQMLNRFPCPTSLNPNHPRWTIGSQSILYPTPNKNNQSKPPNKTPSSYHHTNLITVSSQPHPQPNHTHTPPSTIQRHHTPHKQVRFLSSNPHPHPHRINRITTQKPILLIKLPRLPRSFRIDLQTQSNPTIIDFILH